MSQLSRAFTGGVFPPGTVVQTLTGNTGGPVGPDASNNIDIIGGVGIDVTGNPGLNTLTIDISDSIAGVYVTDSGNAIPVANTLNVLGAHGINTSGAGDTVTIAVNNTLTLGDLTPVAGASLTLTTGDATISAGNLNLPNTTGAGTQGEITFGGSRFISNFAGTNTFIGANSGNTTLTGFSNFGGGSNVLQSLTSGSFNTNAGFVSGTALTAGSNNSSYGAGSLSSATGAGTNQNTAIGSSALNTATSPVNNIAIGYFAGSNFATNETDNIIIGNIGTVADSSRIRIGTRGTQTSTFIVGIDGVNIGSTAQVVTMGTAGTIDQLGTAIITAGSGITVTPGANTITISSTGADILAYTNVTTTPYVVLTTDEYLSVDTSALAITIQLPNAATLGRVYYVKDRTGAAATRNITVTTLSGAVNIDGATTFVMNTNYQSVNIIGNGTTYEVF